MSETATSMIDLNDAPVSPAPAAPEVRGETVSVEGAARALEDEREANAMGFAVAPPIYQIGTMVVQAGVDNFRASRQDFDAMAGAGEVLHKLVEQVKAEDRQDHLVQAINLSMLPDGLLCTKGNGCYPLSERGFESLSTFITPGGGAYLAQCPPNLRAENMNHWFPRAMRLDKRALNRAMREREENPGLPEPTVDEFQIPREVTLRTRKAGESRETFAVTGPRYGVYDINQLAEQIAQGLDGDARADIVYDGYKARINVLFHSNIVPEKAVAGEIFKAGMMIKTADDGSGALKFHAQVWRNLCLNLIVIDFKQLLVGSRRHIGTGESIAADVRAHLEATKEKIGYFVKKWDESSVENVMARYDLASPQDVIKGLCLNKVVHVPGVRPVDLIGRLTKAWEQEPGYTKTAYINAVTRMAHEESWRTWTTTEDLETTASALLFAKEWDVRLPEKQSIEEALA